MPSQTQNNQNLLMRYCLWAKSRYPLKNWIFSVLVYLSVATYVRAMEGLVYWEVWDVSQALAVGCFFLLLRIYDEHKDYDIDLKFHPERPVAQGIVTLRELRYLFFGAFGFQVLSNYLYEGPWGITTQVWVVAVLWSLLMAKEFFVGVWLQQHLFLYAFSHMLIMVPLAYWMVLMGDSSVMLQQSWIGVTVLLVFLTGAIMEVARKTHAPQDEIPGVDSYSSLLGARGSITLLLVMDAVYIACLVYLLGQLSPSTAALGLIPPALMYFGCLKQSRDYLHSLSGGGGTKVEASHGLLILSIFVSMIVASCLA